MVLLDVRYLGGLTVDQTAEALGISTSTVDRDSTFARTWLFHEIKRET